MTSKQIRIILNKYEEYSRCADLHYKHMERREDKGETERAKKCKEEMDLEYARMEGVRYAIEVLGYEVTGYGTGNHKIVKK